MCQTEVIDKSKTHFFHWNPHRSWHNVKNYDRDGQSTDDSIIRRTPFTCRVGKATDTHSECVIFILPHSRGYVNAPQCSAIRRLPLLLQAYFRCKFSRKFLSGFLFFLITAIYWSFSRLFLSSKFMLLCYPLWFCIISIFVISITTDTTSAFIKYVTKCVRVCVCVCVCVNVRNYFTLRGRQPVFLTSNLFSPR